MVFAAAILMTGCDQHIKYILEDRSGSGYTYELKFDKDNGANLKILHKAFFKHKLIDTKVLEFNDCKYFDSNNWECSDGWFSKFDGEMYSNDLDNQGNKIKVQLTKSYYLFN